MNVERKDDDNDKDKDNDRVDVDVEQVVNENGLIYSERGNLSELFCKPKLLPLKSATLKRIEQLQAKQRLLS